jgi:UDP-N-acetylglucosamine--N-acetylmuramyl-(pentapeptide) pyrophosphoryl-undecaprenol N-acetylglucosamine transferase
MNSVVIAAGGTGGHIYPALAVADALKKLDPSIRIYFVGTPTGLENKIVPSHGYPLLHLPIGRLHKSVSVRERLTTLIQMPVALIRACWICVKLRPQFLLGVGGHASGPMLLAASVLRFKTIIWEPNAHPGLANRILSKFVTRCFVVFDRAQKELKSSQCEKVGFPIRKVIEDLGVLPRKPIQNLHLLVYGGSQGALGLSRSVLHFLNAHRNKYEKLEVVLQTGPTHFDLIKSEIKQLGLNDWSGLQVLEYINDMENKYRWCDLVMARSGTGTLSELAATGIPSILVPLPASADGHQQHNAEEMVERGAAYMILQKDLTADKIHHVLQDFMRDTKKQDQMAKAVRTFHVANAAEDIVQRLIRGG